MMKLLTAAVVLMNSTLLVYAQESTLPQPNEAHKVLTDRAGTWDVEVKMYLQGPDSPPAVTKGVEVVEAVSGGMYTRSTFQAELAGQEYEGHGLIGYDPRSEEYVGLWVDNFITVPNNMKGKYDADTSTLTLFSTVVDGDSGQEFKQKQTTTYVDDMTKTFQIYLLVGMGDQQTEVKLMELTGKKRP